MSAWVCSASAVMTAPARSSPSSRDWKAGTSPGAPSTWRWGEHGAGGMVHRGQQVDLAAVASGASQRLAIDRDCPPPLPLLLGAVAVAKPSADRVARACGSRQPRVRRTVGFGRDAVVAGGD